MKKKDSGYKIRTSLEFKTDKAEKGKKKFTLGFFILIGIVMLACVCTLMLLKEYDFDIDNIIGRSPETTETTAETVIQEANLEGKVTFLVAVSNESNKHLHHAALVSADVSSGDIKIYTLDVKKNNGSGKVKGSLSSVFSKSDGSMLRLKEAVEEVSGVEVSRYILATGASFKSLVKTFGGVPYDVPEKVRYSCDGVGYIIEKGKQTLTADMSYKYMYYLSQDNADKPEEMSRFLASILGVTLTSQNYEKADYYYNKLRNTLDTDISAYDFSSNKTALSQVINLFEQKTAALVDSADKL